MSNNKLSPRRLSRSLATQGLYNFQINPKTSSEIEDFLYNANADIYNQANYELMHYLLDTAILNFNEKLELYKEYSTRSLNDIHLIEKAILVIAAIELKNNLEVPGRVIINEAIELAKMYGGEDSFKFINSLVAKLAYQVRSAEMEATERKNKE